jgi:hypothetical protein
MTALAVMLLAASIAGWIAVTDAPSAARAYVRFACVLYAALAAASAIGAQLAGAVTLIVSACAPMLLAIAHRTVFRGPVATSLAASLLMVGCVAGVAAAASSVAVLSFAPLSISVLAMIAISLRCFRDRRASAIQIIAAAIALLAGASAFAAGGKAAQPALLLFSAAGLLGIALALAPRSSDAVVEQKSAPDLRAGTIRPAR